jgi:MoaA/NifB/PqqE/SkfB family radical SAM enzyme
MNYEEKTQKYATWGDKYLQHTDVLYSIQYEDKFKPINIQLCLCEACDSDCPFCSVAARPLKSFIPWKKLEKMIQDFAEMGAKAVEITGGGNPLLYRDKEAGKDINDVIFLCASHGLDVGIITNTEKLERHLDPAWYDFINWIRVSLIKLDEGKEPTDYDFGSFPRERIGLSYIIYDGTGDAPDELSRTNKVYQGTTPETIEKIVELIKLNPEIKFCRIGGNALIEDYQMEVQKKWRETIQRLDAFDKFFIKDVWDNCKPYDEGCYVGLTRPYIAPHPDGGDYQVYVCTSHVLEKRTYDMDFSLGSIDNVKEIWDNANLRFAQTGIPYEIRGAGDGGWKAACPSCFYFNNNKLLHTVAQRMDIDDRNFA